MSWFPLHYINGSLRYMLKSLIILLFLAASYIYVLYSCIMSFKLLCIDRHHKVSSYSALYILLTQEPS